MLGVPQHKALIEVKTSLPTHFPLSLKTSAIKFGVSVEKMQFHFGREKFLSLSLAGKYDNAVNFLKALKANFSAYLGKIVLSTKEKPPFKLS